MTASTSAFMRCNDILVEISSAVWESGVRMWYNQVTRVDHISSTTTPMTVVGVTVTARCLGQQIKVERTTPPIWFTADDTWETEFRERVWQLIYDVVESPSLDWKI